MKEQLRIIGLGDYNNYYSYFNYGIMEGAILNDCWFRPINLFGQSVGAIKDQINFFKPHILLCHCIFGQKGHKRDELLSMLYKTRRAETLIFYHCGDARKEPRYTDSIKDIIDVGLINSDLIDEFNFFWGIPVLKWPYMCLNQREIVSEDDDYKCKIAFTGNLSDEAKNCHYERTQFIDKLSKYIEVKTFPDKKLGNTRFQTAELAASANVVLGIQMVTDLKGYNDVRPFQYIGAGALYFHDKTDNIKEYFIPNNHYIEYDKNDIDGFLELYSKYVKEEPELGSFIRQQGFKYCQANHSTKVRMKTIIDIYNEITG